MKILTFNNNIIRRITGVIFIFTLGLIGLCLPLTAAAAGNQVAGWIPWFAAEAGVQSATKNLDKLDTVYPFVFEVSADGSLIEKSDLSDRYWENFIKKAKRADVEVIPSISWFDGGAIDRVLSNKSQRRNHINKIVEMVEDDDFDGVNIDYEQKLAKTINNFSDFLKELKKELGGKLLTCAIEARTPPADKWRVVPVDIQYANDYKEIARHCDRIELMAYDQQRIDINLNTAKAGVPYIPVADIDWVKKVVKLAKKDFDEKQIVLGVPTYGRVWEVTVAPNWYKGYQNKAALNQPGFNRLINKYKVTAGKNQAGEKSFSYFPEDSVYSLLNSLPTPAGTPTGFEAAAKALLFANYTGVEVPVYVAWYSDADAIADKVRLAKKEDLWGIAMFKIDGEEDQAVWSLFGEN